jgi:prolyl oligopeptidase
MSDNDKESMADKDFKNYLAESWEMSLSQSPIYASMLGDKRFNTEIVSNSADEIEKRKLKVIDSYDEFKIFNINDLSESNRLNYMILDKDFSLEIDSHNYPEHFMDLNQRGGIQSFYETGSRMIFSSYQDYKDWLTRLEKYTSNIKNANANYKNGLELGYTQPKHITTYVLEQIESMVAADIVNNPYLKVFNEASLEIVTPDEKDELILSAKKLIKESLNPAYSDLAKFLRNEYIPNSRDSIGIKDVPNGSEWYEYLARYHTTTDLTPDEIHEIGLTEIKRIRAEMEDIIASVKWSGDFNSFLDFLRTDKRFYYDNADDLFDAYLIMSKKIDPLLPLIFKDFQKAPYGVTEIPMESAPYTTTAYYNSPSKGRPGYYYVNLYKPESRPKYEIPVLSVHEAVPGHHFQISIAQEMENVPEFRKHQSFTSFVEGWALYSEELGEHMGLYDDPYDKFGQLTYDMWRAIRLVVDTGMHYKDWSRDDAIDLFVNNTAKSILDIENEVDRYIAWPGQALAYKIGQLKILELRTKAEKELGDKYDIKDFHYEVLKRGSVPLSVLESYINEWIESKK